VLRSAFDGNGTLAAVSAALSSNQTSASVRYPRNKARPPRHDCTVTSVYSTSVPSMAYLTLSAAATQQPCVSHGLQLAIPSSCCDSCHTGFNNHAGRHFTALVVHCCLATGCPTVLFGVSLLLRVTCWYQ
jgi:hypothetical protein